MDGYRIEYNLEKRILTMSGHSKFANIKHKKEKNDAAKGTVLITSQQRMRDMDQAAQQLL